MWLSEEMANEDDESTSDYKSAHKWFFHQINNIKASVESKRQEVSSPGASNGQRLGENTFEDVHLKCGESSLFGNDLVEPKKANAKSVTDLIIEEDKIWMNKNTFPHVECGNLLSGVDQPAANITEAKVEGNASEDTFAQPDRSNASGNARALSRVDQNEPVANETVEAEERKRIATYWQPSLENGLFPADCFDCCVSNSLATCNWKTPRTVFKPVIVDGESLQSIEEAVVVCRYFMERGHRIVIAFTKEKHCAILSSTTRRPICDWMINNNLIVVTDIPEFSDDTLSNYVSQLFFSAEYSGGVIVSNFLIDATKRELVKHQVMKPTRYAIVPVLYFSFKKGQLRLSVKANEPFNLVSVDYVLTFVKSDTVLLPIRPFDQRVALKILRSLSKLRQEFNFN